MTSQPASPAAPVPMRRIAVASSIGTTIEFYDFLVYGTAAALVFPTVFFPALGSAAGTVAAFATLAVAFLARPLGAILFGHFGDRLGRKKTLISTLLLMGIATVLIGLLPGAATIGVAAPLLLIFLRVCQGLAVGGEWAGATLLTAEYAPPKQRGRYAMFPQLGPSLGFALTGVTFLITAAFFGTNNQAFLDYGWRIPFIASFLLVAVGLYVRLKIDETPVFVAEQQRKPRTERTRAPLLDVFRHQPREVLLGGGALSLVFAYFYMGTAVLTSYGTTEVGLERSTVLVFNIVGALVMALTTIVSAAYSDRIGRRRVFIIAVAVSIPWSLALFPLLDTGSPAVFGISLAVTLGIVGFGYGPAGASLPEMFHTRYRYTGAGMAYNLAGIIGGGATPLLATQLGAAFGGLAIGVLLAAVGLLSLACTVATAETRDASLSTVGVAEAPSAP